MANLKLAKQLPKGLTPQSYTSIRGHIQTGDLILYTSNGFWGRLIKWRSGSWATHCGVALWLAGRLMLLESKEGFGAGSGPRLVPLSGQGPFYLAALNRKDRAVIERRGCACLGLYRYGWLDCLFAGIGGKALRHNGRMQCAEFAAHTLNWSGRVVETPGGLLKHALANGASLQKVKFP